MMSLDFIAATFMRLMAALQVTLSVWALSVFIGAFIGGGVAWMRVSGVKPLEWFARAYVFVFRGAPPKRGSLLHTNSVCRVPSKAGAKLRQPSVPRIASHRSRPKG